MDSTCMYARSWDRQVSRSVASLVPFWGARESSGPYISYKALLCFSPSMLHCLLGHGLFFTLLLFSFCISLNEVAA